MCGIVGYVGQREALPMLLDGLKRLEYRGYDSAGVALQRLGRLDRVCRVGKVRILVDATERLELTGSAGIGHTRWATHGEPSEANAHPQCDCTGKIAVVHNGIIENFDALKRALQGRKHQFRSDTDTEVLAHLIEEADGDDFESAVRSALQLVTGTYGIAVMSTQHPQVLIGARNGSPLWFGQVDHGSFLASDQRALATSRPKLSPLEDNQQVVLTPDRVRVVDMADGSDLPVALQEIEWAADAQELLGHETHMHKEIFEQPQVVRNTCAGRLNLDPVEVKLGGLRDHREALVRAREIVFVGCGTSLNAAQLGAWTVERYARIPSRAEQASQFVARNPVLDRHTVVFVISQSGTTSDTLDALKVAQAGGAEVFGIVNVVGSEIARLAKRGVYLLAGEETAVASTKAFTSQVTVLNLITLYLAQLRFTMNRENRLAALQGLAEVPEKIEAILQQEEAIKQIAQYFKGATNALFLARGSLYPVAMEGALKLKEISYVHAEGYDASEMKHGPLALIDENMPVVVVAPKDPEYARMHGNIQEVKARRGKIIAVVTAGDTQVQTLADHVITIPETMWTGAPILATIPLQLFAYHLARARGITVDDVDRPRNLAKSVTVP